MIPANLKPEALAVSRAKLPGLSDFWLVWRVIEIPATGRVAHVEYLGTIPAQDGETADAVLVAARSRWGRAGEVG